MAEFIVMSAFDGAISGIVFPANLETTGGVAWNNDRCPSSLSMLVPSDRNVPRIEFSPRMRN